MTHFTPRRVAFLGIRHHTDVLVAALGELGFEVLLFDPVPGRAEGVAQRTATTAVETISAAVAQASLIIDGYADRAQLKQKLYQRIQAEAEANPIIVGLTDDLLPEQLQDCVRSAEQVVAGRMATADPWVLVVDGGPVARKAALSLTHLAPWIVPADST